MITIKIIELIYLKIARSSMNTQKLFGIINSKPAN